MVRLLSGTLAFAAAAVLALGACDSKDTGPLVKPCRNRMPPLASRVVDESGVGAVEAWVRGLAACP